MQIPDYIIPLNLGWFVGFTLVISQLQRGVPLSAQVLQCPRSTLSTFLGPRLRFSNAWTFLKIDPKLQGITLFSFYRIPPGNYKHTLWVTWQWNSSSFDMIVSTTKTHYFQGGDMVRSWVHPLKFIFWTQNHKLMSCKHGLCIRCCPKFVRFFWMDGEKNQAPRQNSFFLFA